jgi:hypothetical protein
MEVLFMVTVMATRVALAASRLRSLTGPPAFTFVPS